VVYEYANRLHRRGHHVTVIHPRNIDAQRGPVETVKRRLWHYKVRAKNRPLISWFQVDAGVRLELVTDLRERMVPDGDAIFATAFETAFPVSEFSPNKGAKFYLIQSYETWNGEEASVQASWRLPLHKVVISRRCLEQAASLGEAARTTYVPNGLDLQTFKLTAPIADRAALRVGMLAHPNEAKGMKDGVQALQIVKDRFPELQAVLFGTEARSGELPGWIEYVRRPSQPELVAIYNSCRIFLNPSWTEGWGLSSAEAMACGCALVSADNGGVNEFAVEGENALIVPVKRPELLAERMIQLLLDDTLRSRIAFAGSRSMQNFTWDRAAESLEQVLIQRIGEV